MTFSLFGKKPRQFGETAVNKSWKTVNIFAVWAFLTALVSAHSPHDHIEAFDMAPSRENPDQEVMLTVVRGNLWRSMDRGGTWKRIVRGIDSRWELNYLLAVPTAQGTVWFLGSDGDGIFRSDDDGWT
ncbi:MAG: hypothetical protein KDM64_19445, partial [Verrucomicrobiae bacterium]|nr:hypothetical protein [Verrucomicrobiae bacterium]